MACKVQNHKKWRSEFPGYTDESINTWLRSCDITKHPLRTQPEWRLVRGLALREARRRGLI